MAALTFLEVPPFGYSLRVKEGSGVKLALTASTHRLMQTREAMAGAVCAYTDCTFLNFFY